MRKLKILLVFGLMVILMAAFPGRTIHADPLTSLDHSMIVLSKNHPVPFMGRVSAVITGMTGANPFIHVTVDGSGNVTHLGQAQLHLEEDITFFNAFEGVSVQDITYTAANGDQLRVDAVSTVTRRVDNPDILDIESTSGSFSGGTGRFADATGTYHLKAVVVVSTGMVQAWINGTIMY